MKTKTLIVGIVLAALMVTVSSVSAAVIQTDKVNYAPGETVDISGADFSEEGTVYITITRPDGAKENYNTELDEGKFTYEYELGSGSGDYTIDAKDNDLEAEQIGFTNAPHMPEFASIAIPVAAIIGLFLFFNYRKRKEE